MGALQLDQEISSTSTRDPEADSADITIVLVVAAGLKAVFAPLTRHYRR